MQRQISDVAINSCHSSVSGTFLPLPFYLRNALCSRPLGYPSEKRITNDHHYFFIRKALSEIIDAYGTISLSLVDLLVFRYLPSFPSLTPPPFENQKGLIMRFAHIFFPFWGLIAFALADSNLFLEDSYVDEPEFNTFLIDDVGEFLPTEPASDGSALTDSIFLDESPDRCVSVLPPASRIRRAQPGVCDNPQDGITDAQNSETAEVVRKYWCDTPKAEMLAKIAVCHPESGDKMSSDHFLRKMQGYDFSLGFYETLFRCTLSKTYLTYFAQKATAD